MEASRKCLEIIKRWEGFYPDAYADPGYGWDLPTIGIGTIKYRTLKDKFGRTNVQRGDKVTLEEAYLELATELDEIERALTAGIKKPITQAMFDACCSLAYNIGTQGFLNSTVCRELNAGNYQAAEDAFDLWVKSNDKIFPGLVNRRNDERDLFDDDGFPSQVALPEVEYAPAEVPCPFSETITPATTGLAAVWLNRALMGLGLLAKGLVPQTLTEHSIYAIKRFQRDVMNDLSDAKVGPVTKAWLERKLNEARGVKDYTTITLKRTGKKNARGLEILTLTMAGQSYSVVSGVAGKQNFRLPTDPQSYPGCLEPIPQGIYTLRKGVHWAGGKGDWNASHGKGLGPWMVYVDDLLNDDRGLFRLHNDPEGNGTAGCIGFARGESERFIADYETLPVKPTRLDVSWGI